MKSARHALQRHRGLMERAAAIVEQIWQPQCGNRPWLTIGLRPTQAQEHFPRRDRTFESITTLPGFSECGGAGRQWQEVLGQQSASTMRT